jgi:hypothetical protein
VIAIAVLIDIANFLAASGLGVYDPVGITSSIYIHELPPAPAVALSVKAYGAAPPGPYLFDATLPTWENPRVQIMVRDPDADAGFARCYAAWKALIGLSDVALGGIHYFKVRSVIGPIDLSRDDNNNWLSTCSVECMRTLS